MRGTGFAPALLTAALLSGCVVVPAHRAGYYGAAPVVVVDAPPPPQQVEVMPAMPYPGAVWINGYWGWRGGRHHWVPGYYERPRSGYRYEPNRWESRGGRWHLRMGGWIRL
ncbi:hypothetical protein [Roseateles asaccharophilus]|uniref:YXWGXW repeat-containing protein n=1 Tax=Roseateles asaccharophilus TaxID=582607 RepID=A0ABU2A8X7_9BURK|nr:hypothetical protein [Roseateles asaccharophilus]MDR7333632.1 hypothetical protein [Roseateles asaccharophilus]